MTVLANDTMEKEIRMMLRNAAWLAGSSIFLLGLGLRCAMTHEIHQVPHVFDLIQDLKDLAILGVSALHGGLAVFLCARAWMMVQFGPEKAKA